MVCGRGEPSAKNALVCSLEVRRRSQTPEAHRRPHHGGRALRQSTLKYNADDSERNYNYDPTCAPKSRCRLIANDLPLSFGNLPI
jgi:hypothetical protein